MGITYAFVRLETWGKRWFWVKMEALDGTTASKSCKEFTLSSLKKATEGYIKSPSSTKVVDKGRIGLVLIMRNRVLIKIVLRVRVLAWR